MKKKVDKLILSYDEALKEYGKSVSQVKVIAEEYELLGIFVDVRNAKKAERLTDSRRDAHTWYPAKHIETGTIVLNIGSQRMRSAGFKLSAEAEAILMNLKTTKAVKDFESELKNLNDALDLMHLISQSIDNETWTHTSLYNDYHATTKKGFIKLQGSCFTAISEYACEIKDEWEALKTKLKKVMPGLFQKGKSGKNYAKKFYNRYVAILYNRHQGRFSNNDHTRKVSQGWIVGMSIRDFEVLFFNASSYHGSAYYEAMKNLDFHRHLISWGNDMWTTSVELRAEDFGDLPIDKNLLKKRNKELRRRHSR